jgi:hypothetical protein
LITTFAIVGSGDLRQMSECPIPQLPEELEACIPASSRRDTESDRSDTGLMSSKMLSRLFPLPQ